MAANATRALLLMIGVLVALSAVGIPLGALSVLGGAVGVGIGFGLQKLAANYVSGFVILAERSLRIGDVVKVDNFEGRITDIHTRYTVDPRAQRPRVDRAQRDADHAAHRERVAGRPQRARSRPWCRWPTAPTCDALMPSSSRWSCRVPRVSSTRARGCSSRISRPTAWS